MIKISVIVPIYNHSSYVIECLESVVSQRDECFEIIAIDDGSTDKSYGIALGYLCENLPAHNWWLATRKNRGINKTLNEAIEKSSGEIIYLLASDDRMPKHSLRKIREIYLSEKERDKLFFYDVCLIDWQGEVVKQSASSNRRGGSKMLASSRLYLASQIILSWGYPFAHQFYSRKYFEKYGPYPEDIKYEDLYFALKAISEDRFVFIPSILKEYRLRKNQIHTPGLSLDDLDKKNVFSKKFFRNSAKLRYLLIMEIGRIFFCESTKYSKYFYNKIGSLIQIIIYFLVKIRNK